MGKSTSLMLLLVFWLATTSVWAEQQAAQDAKQNSDSWTEWITNKLSEGLGLKQDNADNVVDKAGDAASMAGEKVENFGSRSKSGAQDAANYDRDNWDQSIRMPTERSGNAAQEIMAQGVEIGKHKVANAYDDAKEKLNREIDFVSDKAYDSKEATADMYGEAKQRMNWATDKASDKPYDAKEGAANMHGATKQKMGSASNLASDKAYDAKEAAANMYGGAKDRMNYASNVAADRVTDAKESVKGRVGCGTDKAAGAYDHAKNTRQIATATVSDKAFYDAMEHGRDRATDTYDGAKEKMNFGSDKAYDAKDKVAGGIEYGREKAANSYDEAKQRVGKAYREAKDTVSHHTRHNYEAAKERASQATGDLGAKMRN